MSQFLSCTNHDKTKSYEKCYKTNSQSSLVIGIRSHFYIYQRKIWQRLCQYNQEWERERERERDLLQDQGIAPSPMAVDLSVEDQH